MRVSTQMQADAILQSVKKLEEKQLQINQSISTGKKVNVPSDDPTAFREILNIRGLLATSSARLQSINQGTSRLQSSEDAISSTTDLIQRAKELALQANNDTNTAQDRANMATEVQQLLQGLVSAGNTKIDGRYLFSGFKTQTAAYALDSVSATGNSPAVTASSSNTGSTTASVAIQTAGSLTGQKYTIEFTSATNFNVVNQTTGATVLSNQTYTSGGNIDFDGLRVVLTSNPSGPLAGDTFTIDPFNASDATISASVSDSTALQPDIYEIRFTSSSAFDLVDLTTNQVLSTGNTYTSGGNIVFAGITAVVTDGTVSPQAGDVFRVRTDYSYQGDTGSIGTEVGDNLTVTTNTIGSQAFSGPNVDIFHTLQDLNEALLTNNTNSLNGIISNLDAGLNQLTVAESDIGARVNRLDTIQGSINLLTTNVQTRQSNLEDTDLAQASSDLTLLQTQLNASLLVLQRQSQISLLNFLS